MNSVRRLLQAAGATAIAVSSMVVTLPAAQAAPMYGCRYPLVCIYRTPNNPGPSNMVWQYRYFSDGWNKLPSPVTNFSIANTRDADVVYYKYTGTLGGGVGCIKPNAAVSGPLRTVTHIQIINSAYCRSVG